MSKRGRLQARECKVRDLPASGWSATLLWMRLRFDCGNCGSRWLEDHDFFDNKLTRRPASQLTADAQVMADPCGGAASRGKLGGDHRLGAGVVASDRGGESTRLVLAVTFEVILLFRVARRRRGWLAWRVWRPKP